MSAENCGGNVSVPLRNLLNSIQCVRDRVRDGESNESDGAFNLSNFWDTLNQAVKAVSQEATKLSLAFSKPPLPSQQDVEKLAEPILKSVLTLSTVYYWLPKSQGVSLRRHIRDATVEVLEGVEQLVEVILSTPLQRYERTRTHTELILTQEQLTSTGSVWSACDQFAQLPQDNKAAVLVVLSAQVGVVKDAIEEIEQALSEDHDPFSDVLDDDQEGEEPRGNQDTYWSERDRQVIAPCQGLMKASAACLRKLTSAIKSNGDAGTPQNLTQLGTTWLTSPRRSAPALNDSNLYKSVNVDDLALCLYPPMDYSGVESNVSKLVALLKKVLEIISVGTGSMLSEITWSQVQPRVRGVTADLGSVFRRSGRPQPTKSQTTHSSGQLAPLQGVDLNSKLNNTEHHTSEISVDRLIVRRGQPFKLTLKVTQPLVPHVNPVNLTAVTDTATRRSRSAKAVWKAQHQTPTMTAKGADLIITPPADAPIGNYSIQVKYKDTETVIKLSVLFNPWCPDDWVYLLDENERQEYVMNEQGIIYTGAVVKLYHLFEMGLWTALILSFPPVQFEEDMVDICVKILDRNNKHFADPADDVSARCNPIYVSRVVSAMINSEDDRGVVQGRWGNVYSGGVAPTEWTGSHAILKKWFNIEYPVKYGQCWVFAGVMCSVMRLLGIPCRVVTNFESAHDNNGNLMIDVYYGDYGVRVNKSQDSIWNFHVWVEGWMKRPDLGEKGKYDGWQVLDPTPQEKSDNVYCCGPAPVKAILDGETQLKYDVPFVFAEVNADCVDWLVKANGTHVKMTSDTTRVGQNISTKSVGSNKRMNITDTYKYKEGSQKERDVFDYAVRRNKRTERMEALRTGTASADTVNNETNMADKAQETPTILPPPPVSIRFEQVTKPTKGKDVTLNLVLRSESSAARKLTVNIGVQAMVYNGSLMENIQKEVKEETLQPGTDLSIPILVPFSTYVKPMMGSDSMKISAIVVDKQNPVVPYLAVNDVVLLDPPVSVTTPSQIRVNECATGEFVFMNPVNEILKNCALTLSGSGLFKEEFKVEIPNMSPSTRIRIKFPFCPYKTGEKILMANFDCSIFRNIKCSSTFTVID
ncbi:hypothetical protein L3Q82_024533 [Scortum barcoo]|uniref:Uncharacterized protein n=1 Tax=Scortum barcoo TaxID=214431 RepID=A0ACB8WQX8_9TELE|nr:hypothetical protein L3Q82_024533 [Scortum barcoo]